MTAANTDNVTFFTTCKPFTGEAAVLQRNALMTWKKLGLRVIICGPEDGAAEAAAEFSATHIPDIETNGKGTPLIRSIFAEAEKVCDTPFLAYINADILLTPPVITATSKALAGRDSNNPFLMTLRRRNIPLGSPLAGGGAKWLVRLQTLDRDFGSWDQSNAIDLFLYSRGVFNDIIPLVIGHMQWDNWLLWKARDQGANVIDASLDAALLHPVHGYGGGNTGLQHRTQGLQAVKNRELAAGNSLDLTAATTHLLAGGKQIVRDARAKEKLEKACAPDLTKEFWAGIEYLAENSAERSIGEMLDCCRTILWRHTRFFPFFEDASTNYDHFLTTVTNARACKKTGNLSKAGDIIQDLMAGKFLARSQAAQQQGREIHIWGCGTAGKRVLGLLQRHEIPVSAFRDSNPAKVGTIIDGVPVVDSNIPEADTEDAPYLLIASMHASEIASSFEDNGLQKHQDYTG